MVANIFYKLTCFADYSPLTYNKRDIINVMNAIDEFDLSPSLLQEIDGNGASQRMQFTGNNGGLLISVGSERIDIQLSSNRREGFTNEEVEKVQKALLYCMTKLYEVFGKRVPLPYRLAWNTAYVYFDIDQNKKEEYRDRFQVKNPFFSKNPLEDMVVRYGARRDTVIGGRDDEKVNIITTIGRFLTSIGDNEVDGYQIEHDINTWQMNRINRFTGNDIVEFIKKAYKIQLDANESVLP